MAIEQKICTKCQESKALTLFHRGRARCKQCEAAYRRRWRSLNRDKANEWRKRRREREPEAVRDYWRRTNRKRYYGLTEAEYQNMLESSGGACGICREPFCGRPSIDHDHKTGKVRGLLCKQCNFGLGHFRDKISFLNLAADYLGRHGHTE